MKILYFDTSSLFYSQSYIKSNERVLLAYEKWRTNPRTNLLKVVKPDLICVEKLRSAAIESGFKLYPLGNQYKRSLFIECGLFAEDELAPDRALNLHIGDNDPIRKMIAHSQALEATWYLCGDAASEILSFYPEQHLTSTFGLGVTDELIHKIRATKRFSERAC